MSTTPKQINSIADREFGNVTSISAEFPSFIPRPNTYWIGLLTQAPNSDGTFSGEISAVGTNYTRIPLQNSKSDGGLTYMVGSGGNTKSASASWLTAANNGEVSNAIYTQFPTATAPWGVVTYVGIFNQQNGGQLLYWSQQTVGKAFDIGDIAFFDAGDIRWTVQNMQII